jgi:hypothetical protein
MIKGIVRCSVMLLVSVVLAGSAAYAAEQYQTEVSAIYSRFESGADLRITTYGPGVEWYFSPVNTTDHSYAEAAFLERIGSVFAAVRKMDFELGALDADGPVTQIGINYTRPDFPFAIKAEAGYGNLDIDTGGDVKLKSHLLSAGYFFAKTLLAGFEYSREKEEVSIATMYLKQTDYALFGKYVHELSDHRELNFEARLSRETFFDGTDELTNTAEEILVDYFPSRSLSIGAGIANSSGQEASREGMTYSARARYFIVPQFSIEAGYERFLAAHDGYDDEKTLDVVLAARF